MTHPHSLPLDIRWTTAEDLDRVSHARWLSFGNAESQRPEYTEQLAHDARCGPTDHLLAEINAQVVATATSLPMTMYIRGSPVSCQGVANVGTIKTARRRGSSDSSKGIASSIVRALLDRARQQEFVVSALMPFRSSFYEHFGYGIVERRVEWTVPISILPKGPTDGWRLAGPDDLPARKACRQRGVEIGQCDIVRTDASWRRYEKQYATGLTFVRSKDRNDIVNAAVFFTRTHRDQRDIVVVEEFTADSPGAFLSIIHFLATLTDEYHAVQICLPADLPLSAILRQTQLPHRRVAHDYATSRPFTRMQLRVINHRRLLESMILPQYPAFRTSVAITESEGTVIRLGLGYESGRIELTNSPGETTFACNDTTWAAIVTGALSATTAVNLGLATTTDPAAAACLNIFAAGPAPFCNEYF
jgi:predicted acetyltransferase